MKLDGTLAVITGAGSGIGRATAHAFVAAGARVALCDIDEPRIAELGRELGAACVLATQVDVADRAAMAAFADACHAIQDGVDVIVNNAGVAVGGTFLETSLDDWDWLLGINLRGVVHGCHFFAPNMVARGRGQIVNLASILGIFPAPQVTAYVASKFAVLGMSQSLRTELEGTGVGVTAICPGLIDTAIVADGRLRGAAARRKDSLLQNFKRGLDPARVAAAIVDAARTNPAVKTVGRDAWAIHQLVRMAPGVVGKVGGMVAKRMG